MWENTPFTNINIENYQGIIDDIDISVKSIALMKFILLYNWRIRTDYATNNVTSKLGNISNTLIKSNILVEFIVSKA